MWYIDREALNGLRCSEPPVENEADHFMLCPECGQAFDMRLLGDALHHDQPGHLPLRQTS